MRKYTKNLCEKYWRKMIENDVNVTVSKQEKLSHSNSSVTTENRNGVRLLPNYSLHYEWWRYGPVCNSSPFIFVTVTSWSLHKNYDWERAKRAIALSVCWRKHLRKMFIAMQVSHMFSRFVLNFWPSILQTQKTWKLKKTSKSCALIFCKVIAHMENLLP